MAKKVSTKKVGAKKRGRGKLTDKQRLTCLIPVKLTSSEYKMFVRITKELDFLYVSQLSRKVVLGFMEDYEAKKMIIVDPKTTFYVDVGNNEGTPV